MYGKNFMKVVLGNNKRNNNFYKMQLVYKIYFKRTIYEKVFNS